MFSVGEKIAFIETVFGKVNVSRDARNVAIWCPACAHSDRSKRKLVIRTDNDALHCWVCGFKAKSLAPLLRKFAPSRLEEYRERFNPTAYIGLPSTADVASSKLEIPQGFRLLATAPAHDLAATSARSYVLKRGLSEQDLWLHKFGVSDAKEMVNRVILPSFDAKGELNFYSARALGRAKPKYLNSVVPRMNVIFNELNIDWTKRLVICEGAFDMVKCGDNVTPLLGSNLTEEYALFDRIVMHGTPVAIALDNDMEHKKHEFARRLAEYDIDVSIVDLGDYHDPGEMKKKEFLDALNSARSWNWDVSFQFMLNNASKVKLKVADESETIYEHSHMSYR